MSVNEGAVYPVSLQTLKLYIFFSLSNRHSSEKSKNSEGVMSGKRVRKEISGGQK